MARQPVGLVLSKFLLRGPFLVGRANKGKDQHTNSLKLARRRSISMVLDFDGAL